MSHPPCRNAAPFKPLLPSSPGSRLRARSLTGIPSSCSPRRSVSTSASSRRDFLLLIPSLAAASAILRLLPSSAAADDEAPPQPPTELSQPSPEEMEAVAEEEVDESTLSRVYDATVIGEPEAVGRRDARGRVWEKLTAARVVYLGEAELVPDPDDRVLELEIVKGLATRCTEAERGVAVALEVFPCDLQQQLDQFMDGRIDGIILKLYTLHWPQDRWEEYEPLLNYCRDTGIKLIACGTPLEVIDSFY